MASKLAVMLLRLHPLNEAQTTAYYYSGTVPPFPILNFGILALTAVQVIPKTDMVFIVKSQLAK